VKRRDFLRGAAVVAAGAATGVASSLVRERSARAFGEVPAGDGASTVPAELQVQSVLEVFLYGGVSQFESFYCVPAFGQADKSGWYLFLDSGDVQAALDVCGVTGPLTQPFGVDAGGNAVHLGPFVMPIRNRPDVMSRMRVSITAHDLEPHEGAIPLALGGRMLGDPLLAGLGAHVQRYFLDRNTIPGRPPFSYVLEASTLGFPADNIAAATAIGMHPAAARPLGIKVDTGGDITTLLARGTVGKNRAQYDALMQQYIDAYSGRLQWKGVGAPLRAPPAVDLGSSAAEIANAAAISAVLAPRYFQTYQGTECGDSNVDTTTMSLALATHLLTHPTTPARYACVIDGGLVMADGGGGYDTHVENSHTQARNLGHTLKALMALINEPGENDPAKLDLDTTMIVLTTEFGRTPTAQDGGKGRNHWPYGFPITFIGGPIRGAGAGVFGACGPDSMATVSSSPQENRIAALLALGIWPFDPESYGVSDVPGATTEAEAAEMVKKRQLGLT
jgi:hypothetical protein